MEAGRARPYLCKLCGRRLHTISALQQHTRIHRAVFPYQCSVCSKSFRLLAQLKGHQVLHDEEKPLMCGWCDECFLELYQLGQHLLRQHKILASSIGTKRLFASPGCNISEDDREENGTLTSKAAPYDSMIDDDIRKTGDQKTSCEDPPEESRTSNCVAQTIDCFLDKGVPKPKASFEVTEQPSEVNQTESSISSLCCGIKTDNIIMDTGAICRNGFVDSMSPEESLHVEQHNDIANLSERTKRIGEATTVDLNGNAMETERLPSTEMEKSKSAVMKKDPIPYINNEDETFKFKGDFREDMNVSEAPLVCTTQEGGGDTQTEEAEMNEAILLLTELKDAEVETSEEKEMVKNNEVLEDEQSSFQLAMMTDEDSRISTSGPSSSQHVLRGDPSLHVCPSREDLLLFEEGVGFSEEGDCEKVKSSEISMAPVWSNSCSSLSALMMTGTPHKLSVDPGAASLNASPAMSPFRATIGHGDSDTDDSDTETEIPMKSYEKETGKSTEYTPGPVTVDKESSISPGHTETNDGLPIEPDAITFGKSSAFAGLDTIKREQLKSNSSLDKLRLLTESVPPKCKEETKDGLPEDFVLVNGVIYRTSKLNPHVLLDHFTSDKILHEKEKVIRRGRGRAISVNPDPIPLKRKRKLTAKMEDCMNDEKNIPRAKRRRQHSLSGKWSADVESVVEYNRRSHTSYLSQTRSNSGKFASNKNSDVESKNEVEPVRRRRRQCKSGKRLPKIDRDYVPVASSHKNSTTQKTLPDRRRGTKYKSNADWDHSYGEIPASSDVSEHSDTDSIPQPVSDRSKSPDNALEYNLRPKRRKNFQSLQDEGNAECECCTYAHLPMHRSVNVRHFQQHATKVLELRGLISTLIKTVFPDINYPNLFRADSLAVEYLMDEIIGACTERRRKKNISTPFGKIEDEVKVVVCKFPKGCLRHLRRKAVRLLNTLLPEIQSEGLELSGVDALIKEVIQTNLDAMVVDQPIVKL